MIDLNQPLEKSKFPLLVRAHEWLLARGVEVAYSIGADVHGFNVVIAPGTPGRRISWEES